MSLVAVPSPLLVIAHNEHAMTSSDITKHRQKENQTISPYRDKSAKSAGDIARACSPTLCRHN